MMNNEIDLARSIRKALWILVALISVLAVGAAAQLTTNLYWWWTKNRNPPEQSIRVVVAARDVKAGEILGRQDIDMAVIRTGELPDHFVCVHMFPVLPGNAVQADVKKGDPIDLEQTDLWEKSKRSQQSTLK